MPESGKIAKVRSIRCTQELYFNRDAARNPANSTNYPPGTPMVEPSNPIVESPPSSEEPTINTTDQPPQTHSETSTKYFMRPRGNVQYNELSTDDFEYVSTLNTFTIYVPNSYNQAINSADKNLWVHAMAKQIAALKANNTWDLVELPPGIKPVGG